MSNLIVTHDRHRVATVAINRQDIHNAFDDALVAELTHRLNALNDDPEVRVVVLTGVGKSFSAGADLNWMRRVARYSEEQNYHDAMALGDLMGTLNGLEKPTIAKVNGSAFGGGVGLIACCDIAIAVDSAQFAFSEARLGLIPAVISPYVVTAIGERVARRYFLTAERFGALEARNIGLLHEVVPAETLDRAVDAMIESLLQSGPNAQREAKDLISAVTSRPATDSVVADTVERIARVRVSPEGQDGLAAFLDKRKPGWMKRE
jgi:methylglutaconyl-CoA hydratase